MSFQGKSLLDTHSLTPTAIESLFLLSDQIRSKGWSKVQGHKLVSLVFLEPSTRTTSSFEAAALKSGHRVMKLEAENSTKKGETLLDTLLTLNAMKPDVFVVRHGTKESLAEIAPQLNVPILNAGEGVSGHPTQALLDAYTIEMERGKVEGEKILIIGDVKHSRVAASGLELFKKLGAEVAVCGPKEWTSAGRRFDSLKEGLAWATVCMALRVQKERHSAKEELDLVENYQLNAHTLKWFSDTGIVMHPAPFNRGVELTDDVLKDPRCVIWKQVENGVYIRGALLALTLGVAT